MPKSIIGQISGLMLASLVTMVNLRGWLCNKISSCLPGCGLKASTVIVSLVKRKSRLLLPQNGGNCYAMPEQAIELLMFAVPRNTGGLVNNPSVSSSGQDSVL